MSGLKNKITSHLPGHKYQDKNMNGIPDRLESNPSNRNGPLYNQGGLVGNTYTTTSTTSQPFFGQNQGYTDLNRDGIPDQLQGGQQFTDFNRNGIPDQLEGQQSFGFVGSTTLNSQPIVDVREAPVIVSKIEKPTVIHEVIKTEEVIQIQPIIERERDQVDVYEVVQPMRAREVMATEVRQAVLPAQTRSTIVEDNSAFLAQRSVPADFSTREVAATMTQTVTNAPIVHETIVHKVVEEVQPVIYKEIDRPILLKETLPVYEKVVEAPHAHKSVLPMRDLGVRGVATATSYGYQTTGLNSGIQSQGTFQNQGLTDFNRNGIPDQFEGQQRFNQQGLNQQGLTDFNRNGIPDQLEGQQGFSQGQQGLTDFNRNGIPDQFEGQQGFNQGRVAPRTLSDLNGNGIPDRMEKGHGLKDLNGNGIPDSLERRMGATTLGSKTY